jgi:hypothetical protein
MRRPPPAATGLVHEKEFRQKPVAHSKSSRSTASTPTYRRTRLYTARKYLSVDVDVNSLGQSPSIGAKHKVIVFA